MELKQVCEPKYELLLTSTEMNELWDIIYRLYDIGYSGNTEAKKWIDFLRAKQPSEGY